MRFGPKDATTAAVKGRREKMRSQIVINTQRHKLEPNVSADKSWERENLSLLDKDLKRFLNDRIARQIVLLKTFDMWT